MEIYYFVIIIPMSPEAKVYDDQKESADTKKLEQNTKSEAVQKQEDISKKYPDLRAKDKGILAGLDIKLDAEKGVTPEMVNDAMTRSFDTEINKAGTSGKTTEISQAKADLSEKISKTTDMKEKIALYQEFLNELKGNVGTAIAEQNQRAKQNSEAMNKEVKDAEKNKNSLGELVRNAQINEKLNKLERRAEIRQQEQQEAISALRGVEGWPGNMAGE